MKLLFRPDASSQRGSGHLMRCLALAQEARQRGVEVTFVTNDIPAGLRDRLSREGFPWQALRSPAPTLDETAELSEIARRTGASWIVLDGYLFSREYQARLAGEFRVLQVDDHAQIGSYAASLILDQNLGVPAEVYADRPRECRLLLGAEHVLLRREFRASVGSEVRTEATSLLITMGGADPANLTQSILHQILPITRRTGIQARALVGMANPHRDSLEAEFGSDPSVTLLDPADWTPALMAGADIAITAGGTTCWELAFLGRPMIVLSIAGNQDHVLTGLAAVGAAVTLGSAPEAVARLGPALEELIADGGARADLSARARTLVDGHGARRVLGAMKGALLSVRDAGWDDSRMIWEWANDPVTRGMSFSTDPIPLEGHERWFRQRLDDPGCLFGIGIDEDGGAVGQVRLENAGEDERIISMSLAPEHRGLGLGSYLIEEGVRRAAERARFSQVHAYIKSENQASVRAFMRAGFVAGEPDGRTPPGSLHFVRCR